MLAFSFAFGNAAIRTACQGTLCYVVKATKVNCIHNFCYYYYYYYYVRETGEVHITFSYVNLRQRNHLEDIGIDGRIIQWNL